MPSPRTAARLTERLRPAASSTWTSATAPRSPSSTGVPERAAELRRPWSPGRPRWPWRCSSPTACRCCCPAPAGWSAAVHAGRPGLVAGRRAAHPRGDARPRRRRGGRRRRPVGLRALLRGARARCATAAAAVQPVERDGVVDRHAGHRRRRRGGGAAARRPASRCAGCPAARASATTSTPTAATGRPGGSPASSRGARRERGRDDGIAARRARRAARRRCTTGSARAMADAGRDRRAGPGRRHEVLPGLRRRPARRARASPAIGENRDQEAVGQVRRAGPPRPAHACTSSASCRATRPPRSPHYADVVQSVDRAKVVRRPGPRRAEQAGRRLEVTVQVNLDEAPGRGGVAPAEARALADLVAGVAGADPARA